MRKMWICAFFMALVCLPASGAEERIRGVLEHTVKPGACAQITDALSETYFVLKTGEAEKLVAEYVGKNIRVVLGGIVEQKEGDPAYYFSLKSVEKYVPKLPPAPPPPITENKPAPKQEPAPVKEPEVKSEPKPGETK